MEISVSCMEDVRNGETILLTDPHHLRQHLGEFRSWNGPVADKIIRPESGNGTKRSFSTCPELGSLCLGLRSLHFTDVIFLANLHDSFGQSLHPIFQSVELNEKDSL